MSRLSVFLAALLVAFLVLTALAPPRTTSPEGQRVSRLAREAMGRIQASGGLEDDADAQAEMEFLMLRDPVRNQIPRGIHQAEMRLARLLPERAVRFYRNGPSGATQAQLTLYQERGPNNVGGRTRAFAIDVSNPTTLLAGSVAGGMWRSTDDGASWSATTAPGQIHSTTCIAQDRRAGQSGTWYVGSGEVRGSTTNATRWGALYLGDGIFKSIDGGQSWTLLASTSSGTPQTVDPFDYVNNIATNPANLAQDEVLAATYRGIYRSVDGGSSWLQVIAADSGYTDIAITPAGAMYATTRNSGLIRVWRSTNGTSWSAIQPPTFPTVANRVVIGLAPSNPAIAYVFAQGVNAASVAGHQLWRYTYVSGDGSGAGGTWTELTANLPSDLNTQTGYDQIVHVKPDDENFVIIGGTNLYRSTTGFATNVVTTIGGYPFYPDGHHHPDLHAGGFSPANPVVYYSAGDGGISKAADITLPDMVWTSLNHGYNVTQFYSVAISPDAGDQHILAGAQDNGSQLGNAPGASDWAIAYGGDGTIVAVSPAADDRFYTQYQGGQMQRQNWDGSNLLDITPTGAANQMFVNPIVLDPNDTRLLYYAGGTSATTSMIWRSDDIRNATSATGWSSLAATDVGAGSGYSRTISAIGISRANTPNVLYYGTIDGIVKKATNVNTGAPTVTTITPPGLNGGTSAGGFVRCIAVDPTDSQRALVAFGNYAFQSLWYTIDGGANWTDVEGNLAGVTGPSVRWATMFYLGGQLQVFIGTSIGLLSTSALNGSSTIWSQEGASQIGNVIVAWMEYRPSDQTLVVGTHGRGVFSTQFAPAAGVPDEPQASRLRMSWSYPNPAREAATISYTLPRASQVSLRVFDLMGRQVAVLADGPRERGRHDARLSTAGLSNGAYYYVLRAAGAIETGSVVIRR